MLTNPKQSGCIIFVYVTVNFRPKLNPCAEKCDLYALGKEGYSCCCFTRKYNCCSFTRKYTLRQCVCIRLENLYFSYGRDHDQWRYFSAWVGYPEVPKLRAGLAGGEGLEMGGMDKIRFAWYNRKRNERIRKSVCFTRVFSLYISSISINLSIYLIISFLFPFNQISLLFSLFLSYFHLHILVSPTLFFYSTKWTLEVYSRREIR